MSEKITFKELVEQISNQSKQSQNSTNSFIHELVQIIESGLRKNGSVSISGFGKFELKWMKERSGRNPQTGEELTIPGQNKVVFKPYKALREDVNRPYLNMKPQVLQSSPSSSESSTKDEDKEEPKPPKKTPIVPATPTGKIDAESVDEDDEWVFERPKPENIEPKETEEKLAAAPTPPESKISEEKTTTAKPDEESSASKKKLFVASTSSKAAPKAQKNVKKSDSINWTYAAATVIIALAILLVLFLMQQSSDDPSETVLNSGTQDQIESVEQPPAAGDTESSQEEEVEAEPEPVPEAETDEEDPNDSEIITHDVQRGDTLWSISDFRLGNAYLWPWIFRINSSTLDNPNHLQSGSQLSVPYVSNHEDLTDNQLEQVARGYLSVYEWFLQHNPEEAKYFLWAVGVFSMDVLDQAADNIDADDLAFAKNR